MEKNDEHISEQPSTNNKKAMNVTIVLMGLCVLGTFFTAFNKGGGDEEPEKMDYVVQQEIKGDTRKEFDKRFQDERSGFASKKTDDGTSVYTNDIMLRLQEERDNAIRQRDNANNTASKPELEKLHTKENERVYTSRRSPFNLRYAIDKEQQLSKQTNHNRYLGDNRHLETLSQPKQYASQGGGVIDRNSIREKLRNLRTMRNDVSSGSTTPLTLAEELASEIEQDKASTHNPIVHANNVLGDNPENVRKIPVGTVISASLAQSVISDYTGSWRANITEDVYDIKRENILIPKNSRVIGKTIRISNVNEPIQARMGMLVEWVVLPNGNKISFRKSNALDIEGIGAFKDKVDYHFVAQFLGVGAYALLSSETGRNDTAIGGETSYAGDVGASLRSQFAPLAARYLNLVPTITLQVGTPMKIFLEDEVYVEIWDNAFDDYIAGT